jgi:hypothetical protein
LLKVQVTDSARGLTVHAQLGTLRKTPLRDAEEAAHLVLLSRREIEANEFQFAQKMKSGLFP